MQKRSKLWLELNDEEFINLVKSKVSYKEILEHFHMQYKTGGNMRTLKERICYLNINTDHIDYNTTKFKNKTKSCKYKNTLNVVLVENSTYSRCSLKRRLLKNGMLKNECSICGLKNEWQGKKLTLIIDHINGVNNDNRLENLRIVCPNCNIQLDTHSGKNSKGNSVKIEKKIYHCEQCGGMRKSTSSKLCVSCDNKRRYEIRKVDRPSLKQLVQDIEELNYVGTGRKYGVSDNTIRKWIKMYKKYG